MARDVTNSALKCKLHWNERGIYGKLILGPDGSLFPSDRKQLHFAAAARGGLNSLHIAICDDDSFELDQVSSLLRSYRQERGIPLRYVCYQSTAELLSHVKSCRYDLFLLDILMPGLSGIQAAHELRGFDQEAKIIFLTSSPDFALDSYSVRARDYLLKPVSGEQLFAALDSILAEEQEALEGLCVKTQTGMARILFQKLAFVEVLNKRLFFHLSDDSVRELHAPLAAYEDTLLARPEFIKVHRSYIVNLWQMSELTPTAFLTHSGLSIPISRLLYSEVREAYMNHLFAETGSKGRLLRSSPPPETNL